MYAVWLIIWNNGMLTRKSSMNSLVIIPARYASSRFPGKALADIHGKSLIQRVFEQASKSKADTVLVATDDERIFDAVERFDGNVIMTSSRHENGTQRCAEVLERLEEEEAFDVVINLQGDEPFIHPDQINALIDLFDPENEDVDNEVEIATLVKRITSEEELNDPNVVKAVVTEFESGTADALYFSRAPIPYRMNNVDLTHGFYRHVGIYAFIPEILMAAVNLEPSVLEKIERLEQLRWLENHFVITVAETEHLSIGIDSPEDLRDVDSFLKRHPEFK